jgi:pimeloyl-ACP methyl ester carboxylesterase
MIPAQGTIEIDSTKFNYDFAREDSASVHSGYALAIAFLSDSILHQIRALGKEGINDFVITGHSQGGALAQLLTAYLIHHPDADIRRNHYKTYAFASPKVGNKIFAKEYQKKRRSLSFDVINPADIVPKFPFNYNDTDIVTMEDWKAIFDEDKEFGLGTKMKDGAKRMVELPLRSSFRMVGRGASRELNDGEVLIVMPEESKDLNYFVLDSLIEIPSFDYPKILLDSAILENPRSKKWKKDSLGHFVNDEFYRQEPKSWQHKPYNYYVGLLKLYFPDEYEKLSKKYLPENI